MEFEKPFYKILIDNWGEIIKYLEYLDVINLELVNHYMKNVLNILEENNEKIFGYGEGKICIKDERLCFDFEISFFNVLRSFNHYSSMYVDDYISEKKFNFPKICHECFGNNWLIKDGCDIEESGFGIRKTAFGAKKYYFVSEESGTMYQYAGNYQLSILFVLIYQICLESFKKTELMENEIIIKTPGFLKCRKLFFETIIV